MIKAGLGLAVMVAGAYAFVPVARTLIIATAPFLFFLLCPVSMLFMVKSMNSNSCRADREADASKVEASTRSEVPKRVDQ